MLFSSITSQHWVDAIAELTRNGNGHAKIMTFLTLSFLLDPVAFLT